jgi:hypothetical protein
LSCILKSGDFMVCNYISIRLLKLAYFFTHTKGSAASQVQGWYHGVFGSY